VDCDFLSASKDLMLHCTAGNNDGSDTVPVKDKKYFDDQHVRSRTST
jgi:hypothetical protein